MTAIEAETLLLSMKAIDRLLKDNTQSFSEIRLEQRIEIFTKMTQILNLSVSLSDFIDDRKLDAIHTINQKQQSSQHSFKMATSRNNNEDRDQSSIQDQSDIVRPGYGLKRRKKPKKDPKEDQGKGKGHDPRDPTGDKGDTEADESKKDFQSK